MKKPITLFLSILLAVSFSFTAFAATWDYGPGTMQWEQQSNGRWKCKCGDTYYTDKQIFYNGHDYYLDSQGYMVTGWQYVNGQIYYFAEADAENHPVGSKYVNEPTPDRRQVDENGVLIGDLGCRANPYQRTCIEVSIGEQQVYVYNGAMLILQTSCVTGKVSTDTITPTGNYAIQAKIPDKTLKGKNVDGTEYESFVHYWMPFNGGYGLHDASWRKKFGGQIYKTGGSHGCVNLPTDAAAAIYNFCYVGMPVYVHD